MPMVSANKAFRKLKPPTSLSYDAELWRKAYDEIQDKTDADERLLEASRWFAKESMLARKKFNCSALEELGPTQSTIIAIAVLNREYLIINDRSKQAIKGIVKTQTELALDHLAALPLSEEGAGGSEIIETAIDCIEAWVFDALLMSTDKEQNKEKRSVDLATIAYNASKRYSIQHIFNDMWNQALWEGWCFKIKGARAIWSPADKYLATLFDAWRVRQESNFLNYVWIDMAAWEKLEPKGRKRMTLGCTVLEITRTGKREKIKLGRPACLSRRLPLFALETAGLEGSYLSRFLDRDFPNTRINCRLLLKAWHVCHDLAQALLQKPPSLTNLTLDTINHLALLIERKKLINIFIKALSISCGDAEALVDFLTFKIRIKGDKGNRGLWSAPLIPIPETSSLALCLPSLVTSNAIRKVEAWCEKGGLDDNLSKDSRGNLFESDLRQEIRRAIAENTLLKDARCAEHAIKKDKDFGEQIDLLIQLGSLLIVAEVKCWLSPAESVERFNYFKKLKAASEQAKSKASLLMTRPDIISRSLKINEDQASKLKAVAIVVTNQGVGFSLDMDGCRIIEAKFLTRYLRAGKLITEGVMNAQGERANYETIIYNNEKEAEANFEKTMNNPQVLQRFIDRLKWKTVEYKNISAQPFYVETTQLQDISLEQRMRSKVMLSMLRPPP